MIERIVSGGQTGADRAALDAALARGIPIGGWVPLGRLAEDGAIPARYAGLREAPSPHGAVRTELNVRDSDGTLILSHGALAGGSLLTHRLALRLGRPVLHVDLSTRTQTQAVDAVYAWVIEQSIRELNVAGPRASGDPDIHDATLMVLGGVLDRLSQ